MKYSYKEMPKQMKGTFGDFSRSFGVKLRMTMRVYFRKR